MIGRRVVAAGVVVAAVTVGGIAGAVIGIPGLSSASTSLTNTPSSTVAPNAGRQFHGFPGPSLGAGKDVLDAAAKALNLSTKELLQKVSDGKTTIADVAKQQHVPVQDVIDAMAAVAKDDISKIVNNPFPGHGHFGPGGKHEGPGFGFGGGARASLRTSFDAVAKALGVTSDQLRSDLRDGKSIADIAKSKNVDVNGIIDTLVGEAKSRIDAAVKAGHLSSGSGVETRVESPRHDLGVGEQFPSEAGRTFRRARWARRPPRFRAGRPRWSGRAAPRGRSVELTANTHFLSTRPVNLRSG